MPATVSLTEVGVLSALRGFLLDILAPGVEVIRAENNRVPEPKGSDFCVLTPTARMRLATNTVSYSDVIFTGAIVGNTLTVAEVQFGTIAVGQMVTGPGVVTTPIIGAPAILTESGSAIGTIVSDSPPSVGQFTIATAQNVASQIMYAGVRSARQPTRLTVQIDVHGPNSAENAQAISTLLRDGYGCYQFAASGYDVQPLYADEPRQTPFINGENQYEFRWTVNAVLQANIVIDMPQAFFTDVRIGFAQANRISAGITSEDGVPLFTEDGLGVATEGFQFSSDLSSEDGSPLTSENSVQLATDGIASIPQT